MNSIRKILLILLFITIGIIVFTGLSEEASGETIYVDDDAPGGGDGSQEEPYQSISHAVLTARNGDTIRVFEGEYRENIELDRRINLVGNGSKNTSITGDEDGDLLEIEEDRCNVKGFSFIGEGETDFKCDGFYIHSSKNVISNCTISSCYKGIFIDSCTNNTVKNCNITSNYIGLRIESATHSLIIENSVSNNDLMSIDVGHSSNNTIESNRVFSNNGNGISVSYSENISIINNNLSSNAGGITLFHSNHNIVQANTISHNSNGINIESSCENNILNNNTCVYNGIFISNPYRNIFLNNSINGKPFIRLIGKSDIVVENAGQIILANCTNVTIKNQNLSNGSMGIGLWDSNYCTIQNNTLSNNIYGIQLFSSENISIMENYICHNTYGMYIYLLSNTSITQNTIRSSTKSGIYLHFGSTCTNSTIANNTFHHDGMFIFGSYSNEIMYSINISDNSVNGKPLVYLVGKSDISINNAGQILLFDCVNVTIQNKILSDTCVGIELWNTTKCNINNVTIQSCSWNSIHLRYSDNITIANCSIRENAENGIYFCQSENNAIISNNITSNNKNGIRIYYSDSNTLAQNVIDNNEANGILLSHSDFISITNNEIMSNGRSGICLISHSQSNLAYQNNIQNNQVYGINAEDNDGNPINATNNRWGHGSGPFHPENNPAGKGDNVTDYVLFDPWTGKEEYYNKYVDDDAPNGGNGTKEHPFDRIQDAVDAVMENGTVYVWEGTYYENIVVNKSMKIVGNGSEETVIHGVENEYNIFKAGWYDTSEHAYGVAVSGDYAYVADCSNGLVIIDVTDKTDPLKVGGYDTSGNAIGVVVSGDYAYVADDGKGLVIIDITDKTDPLKVSGYDTSGYAYDVAFSGNYVYVADGNNGLVIFDVSNKTNPQKVGGYDTSDRARDVAVAGNYAYVANGNNGLVVVDITDKTDPQKVGEYEISYYACGVAVLGDYVYMADGYNGLVVVDVTDKTDPQKVGEYGTSDYAYGVVVAGDYAYVANGDNGLVVVDITDKTDPQKVGGYDTSDYAYDVAFSSDYAYVADDENGLVIIKTEFIEPMIMHIISPFTSLSGFTIRNNSYAGVLIDSDNVSITNCNLTQNTDGIMIINGSANVEIHNNHIYNNADYGINTARNNGIPINATFNWWGHESGPYHTEKNPDGTGDNITNNVLFQPWRENRTVQKYDFFIQEYQQPFAIKPLESSSFYLNISNTGWKNDTYFIETTTPEGWYVSFNHNVISIPSNNTCTVIVTVHAPENTVANARILIGLIIHSAGNTSLQKTRTVTMHVQQLYNLETSAEYSIEFVPDSGNSVVISVENTGNGMDNFTISVESLPDNWKTDPLINTLSIGAGYADSCKFLITPSSDYRPGSYDLCFRISSESELYQDVVFSVELLPYHKLSWTGETEKTAHCAENVEFKFNVTNLGNIDALIYISTVNSSVNTEYQMVPWNGSKVFTVIVPIPEHAYPEEIIRSNITILYGKDSTIHIPLCVTVQETHNLSINAPQEVTIDPGENRSITVFLVNNGNVPENLTVNLTAPEGITVEPPGLENIPLSAFSQWNLQVNLTVPYRNAWAGKEFNLTVNINDQIFRNITISVSQNYHEILVEDKGFVRYENGTNFYSLWVTNNGTMEETVAPEVTAPEGWKVTLSSYRLLLGPGEQKKLVLEITRKDENPVPGIFELTMQPGEISFSLMAPPVPEIKFPAKGRKAQQLITFSANCSRCIDYSWTLDGVERKGQTITHTFSQSGNHEVILTVEADNGMKSCYTRTIFIENAAPTASFTISLEKGKIVFNASSSLDWDGDVTEYHWVIDNHTLSGEKVVYSFEKPGEYTVRLTVEDNMGGTDDIEKIVKVKKENSLQAFESDSDSTTGFIIGGFVVFVILAVSGILYWRMKEDNNVLLKRIQEMESEKKEENVEASEDEVELVDEKREKEEKYKDFRPPKEVEKVKENQEKVERRIQ